MHAVYYDASSGVILSTVSSTEKSIAAAGLPFLPVDEAKDDYAVTHHVVDGRLVPLA